MSYGVWPNDPFPPVGLPGLPQCRPWRSRATGCHFKSQIRPTQQFADSNFEHSKFSPKFWQNWRPGFLQDLQLSLDVVGASCSLNPKGESLRAITFPCYTWEGAAMLWFLARNLLVWANNIQNEQSLHMQSSKWKWGLGLHARRWSRSHGLLSFFGSLKRVQAWDDHKHPQACCQQFCDKATVFETKKLHELLELWKT